MKALRQVIFHPVDASSVAIFRIGFGLLMFWECWKYLSKNWVASHYIDRPFHFKYYGFSWIDLPDGDGLYWVFLLMTACAILITLGLFYRIAIVLFTLAFAYFFLLDQAEYLNHFYMVILFSFLLCFIPANRVFSLDARWFKLKSASIAYISVWVLRIQLEIILIYAGLVKLNADWLRLEPLASWLERRSGIPLVGDLFLQHWAVALAAYGVIALHLIGAPLLLWRKTRIYVLCIYAAFHTLNHFVFNIGIFPWFTLFASLLFFAPNWPRILHAKLGFGATHGVAANDFHAPIDSGYDRKRQNFIISMVLLWLGFQVLLPARGLLYPGNIGWTEQGHRFAWRMKLRDKYGKAVFYIEDGITGKRVSIDPRFVLSNRQYRKMSVRPDLILQFAHYLRDQEAQKHGIQQARVYADVWASLNFRHPAQLIDPTRDLAAVARSLAAADWILPLQEPFRHSDRWLPSDSDQAAAN